MQQLARHSETLAVPAFATSNAVAQKAVGYWLLGCGGMVFGAVVLGTLNHLYYLMLFMFKQLVLF